MTTTQEHIARTRATAQSITDGVNSGPYSKATLTERTETNYRGEEVLWIEVAITNSTGGYNGYWTIRLDPADGRRRRPRFYGQKFTYTGERTQVTAGALHAEANLYR